MVRSNKNHIANCGMRYFKCREPCHRAIDCRIGDRNGKDLFIDSEEIVEHRIDESLQDPTNDLEASSYEKEEQVAGDDEPLLVIRKVCFATRGVEEDGWL